GAGAGTVRVVSTGEMVLAGLGWHPISCDTRSIADAQECNSGPKGQGLDLIRSAISMKTW
ncbi:hypothetical protein, partial [Streptacidiphilus griseoplanus]|uniref:hypothetical protein n=1 Tax=Peterkaempfera griseoplana TaxID=66896 RepID=UPI001C3783E9